MPTMPQLKTPVKKSMKIWSLSLYDPEGEAVIDKELFVTKKLATKRKEQIIKENDLDEDDVKDFELDELSVATELD